MGIEALINGWLNSLIDRVDGLFIPQLEQKCTEKEMYLLCGEKLAKLKLKMEEEKWIGRRKFTCEVAEIDGDILNPTIAESIEGMVAIGIEDVESVIEKAIGKAGLSTEGVIPVTDRYVSSHRRILSIKKSIMEGGNG